MGRSLRVTGLSSPATLSEPNNQFVRNCLHLHGKINPTKIIGPAAYLFFNARNATVNMPALWL
jgi:hypothetical protein